MCEKCQPGNEGYQSKNHLLRCHTYIDLNMVHNGVVSHPAEWSFGGYNKIHNPRRKCVLIAYQMLAELAGFSSFESFRKTHKEIVNEALEVGNKSRQAQWTESIAVGSKDFVETIKENLGIYDRKGKL